MSAPAYNKAVSPIKNAQVLLRYAKLTPLSSTVETAIPQLLAFVIQRLGLNDIVPTTLTTASAATYTAAQVATGLIIRDPNGLGRTDTTPTAALLISGLSMTADYQQRWLTIHNNADAAETITLAAGVGVTLKGAITCEQSCVIKLCITRTSSTTVAIYQE